MFGSQAEHARAEGAVSLKNSATSLRFIRVLRFKINIPQRVPAPVSGLCTIGQPGSRFRFCRSTSHRTRSPSSHFRWLRASKRESATSGGECGVSKDVYISSESKFVPAKFHAVDDANCGWSWESCRSYSCYFVACFVTAAAATAAGSAQARNWPPSRLVMEGE
jgi:hypothetical protein